MSVMSNIFIEKIENTRAIESIRDEVYRWTIDAALFSGFCTTKEEAVQFANDRILIPFRTEVQKQHCFDIKINPSLTVGRTWLSERRNTMELRLSFIKIDEAFQRQGYAEHAIHLATQYACENGFSKMSLNVFGHLTHAAKLYQKLGFQVVEEFKKEGVLVRKEMEKIINDC